MSDETETVECRGAEFLCPLSFVSGSARGFSPEPSTGISVDGTSLTPRDRPCEWLPWLVPYPSGF